MTLYIFDINWKKIYVQEFKQNRIENKELLLTFFHLSDLKLW